MSFYAVAQGKQCGIFNSWNECQENVKGFKGAKFKKFSNENDAKQFIQENQLTSTVIEPKEPEYYVYMDGACSKNGSIDAKASIGIYFGENDPRNISKKIEDKQTNNVAELNAMIFAFTIVKSDLEKGKTITFVSDSEYTIKCANSYGKVQHLSNWTKDIPNKDLVKTLYESCSSFPNLQFLHVKAHTNKEDKHSLGNKQADLLARQPIY
jgi:ribonuclease HI